MCDHKVGTCRHQTSTITRENNYELCTGTYSRGLQLDYLIKYLHQFRNYHIIGKKPGQFVLVLVNRPSARILLVTCCTLRSTFAARIRILIVTCTLRKDLTTNVKRMDLNLRTFKTNGSHFKTNAYTAFNTAKR